MKLFVYGTLMKGQGANERLNGAKYIGKAVLRDYEMFSLEDYPGIQPCMGGSVVGELYDVSEEMISRLDSYEGEGSLYNREIVNVHTYSDEDGVHRPYIFRNERRAYAYVYCGQSDRRERISFEWGYSEDDYVWYAAYGSNIDEDRFLCYIEGGRCAANGRYYDGCADKSRWIEEDVAIYPGTVYASNHSTSWNGKGVAFYDERAYDNLMKGFAFMRLYKIRIGQLLDVQKQEGRSPSWYGRTVAVGIHKDGVPVYTITSADKGGYSEPDLAYISLIRDAIRGVCKKNNIDHHDFGLDTALILMARNPRYNEKPESGFRDLPHHPYRLLCTCCLNEEKNCTCKQEDPFRYRYYAEIDEDMFEAVRMLNQKGYYTHACCQGDIRRDEKKVSFNSYVAFRNRMTEELPVPGIDPEFVKIKRTGKDQSFNAIYIECSYRIGKKNADAQEKKARQVQEAAKKAWIMMAKAWPDKNDML